MIHNSLSIFNAIACALVIFSTPLAAYDKPPEVDPAIWEEVSPYFLPEEHPVKKSLDKLFRPKHRPNHSIVTLDFAGFKIIADNQKSGLIVAKHPKLKGVILKIYPDDCSMPHDWHNFVNRVEGARSIRESITRYGWENDFNVPQKWIYPIAATDHPGAPGYPKKHFILVVENAHAASGDDLLFLWKTPLINEDKLSKLYVLITELGLIDSVFADNIPINKKGQITFIDTEHHHKYPIPYGHLIRFLNPPMQVYWNKLYTGE